MIAARRAPMVFMIGVSLGAVACAESSQDTDAGNAGTPQQQQPATQPRPDPDTATTQPAAQRPDDVDPRVWDWLGRLEQRGKMLKSYEARIRYTRTQSLLDDSVARLGRLRYVAGPPSRFRVDFKRLIEGGVRRTRNEGYIFDGSWIVHIKPDDKIFLKRQVVAPDQEFDPMKIGQGPFVVPLGQKRNDVIRDFHVTLVEPPVQAPQAETQPAPPADVQLHLVPKRQGRRAGQSIDFVEADLWFDRTTLLPVKLQTVDNGGNETIVEMHDAVVDSIETDDSDDPFDTTVPPEGTGWRIEITPWKG